jgi:(p)ppGpp synthase/HD superfamily hydrolase
LKALEFSTQLHAGQTRKGTAIPYVAHLLAVASLVLTHGGNEDEAIAALLHDAVEDQGGKRDRFGKNVASIVDDCSDTDVEPKPPWKERKERYLAHLGSASPSAKLVAAADKLDNLEQSLRTTGYSAPHCGIGSMRGTKTSCGITEAALKPSRTALLRSSRNWKWP